MRLRAYESLAADVENLDEMITRVMACLSCFCSSFSIVLMSFFNNITLSVIDQSVIEMWMHDNGGPRFIE